MKGTRALLVVALVMVFAAGVAVGCLLERGRRHHRDRSWLSEGLDLSAEQRRELRSIWSEAMRDLHRDQAEQHRSLRAERDEAVIDLLTEQQRRQYEAIFEEYERKMEQLSEGRKAAFEQAVSRTREILTPQQRARYDRMLRRMPTRGRKGPPGGGPPPGHGRPGQPPGPRPEGPQQP